MAFYSAASGQCRVQQRPANLHLFGKGRAWCLLQCVFVSGEERFSV